MMNSCRERSLWSFTLITFCLWPFPVHAQEWTRFRGPNGTGISNATTIPITFTEADYNWRIGLPGAGISSPVIWGQKVFLTSAEETIGKRHLICINAADGRILWAKTWDFPKYHKHSLNSFASSTPTVDANHVYVVWTTPDSESVHAVDHSGHEVWKRDLGTGFNCQHGGASSPVIIGGLVILANDQEMRNAPPDRKVESFIIALDRKTGAIRWKRPRVTSEEQNSYATPMVYRPKDGPAEVIVTCMQHGITSLDPLTGQLNWETGNLFKPRTVGSPVAAGGLIFQTAGTGGGEKMMVAVRPGSKKQKLEPKVAFQIPRDISYVPTPIAYGDWVFFWGDGGVVTCVRADTGEQVWKERVMGTYYGSPVCVNGKLYAMNTRGEMAVIEASDQFKVLGRSSLGEASHSTPAVAGGVMYLRTMSHLLSVGGKANAQ